MKGTILNFNASENEGIISAENGERYSFLHAEWKGQNEPISGTEVDFVISGETATGIYPKQTALQSSAQKVPAALLAFFLGVFGAHKFYLGYKKEGIIMLLLLALTLC